MTAHSHPRMSRTTIRERNAAWATGLRARSLDPCDLRHKVDEFRGARALTPAVDRYTLLDLVDRVRGLLVAVVEDAESQHPGGWGPDVTTVATLHEAINAIDDLP